MPSPATVRERRLRKSKAQLIDEIDTLEQRAAATPEGGSELKRREQELAEKEAQLRVALDNMPGGMMLGDRDLNYVLCNSQYSELYEFPDGLVKVGGSLRDELRYQADRGDFGPGDKDELIKEVVATYRIGEAVSYEREIAGSGRTVQINVAPTPEGGYVSIITDITARKRAEEVLAEKEAQLRVALDNMPGGITVEDRDRNYVLFNSKYSELHDYPEGFLKVGMSAREEVRFQAERGDFGPGNKDELVEQVLILKQGVKTTSWERTFPNGRTLRFNTAPTPEGGNAQIVTDITESKRAEEALVEAKRRAEAANELVTEKNRMLESLSNQLSKYLSPQVYASIFSGEQSVEIASKRKKLTVFFSDIADFTGTTDSLESEELTNLLNHYLTEMSKIALDHGATIDKYVGDAIIAFFGDPETRGVKEDARACVNMAIAMQRRMRELQSEWLDLGLERPFELRIGINTGFCTVGNFGSAQRMDYTIIGNEVNLAARLESLAEVGGILMAHETHSLVKDTVMAEEGDTLTVKGFAKPVRTYSVVGLYDDLAEQGRIIRKEQDGVRVLVDLKKGDKADAIQAIKDVLSQLED
ncbi:MAG: PAS-domain containing protein [Proteobacteria bacterium]|nr:PAS-domain containing protein [Pseudomonadota bacterium]